MGIEINAEINAEISVENGIKQIIQSKYSSYNNFCKKVGLSKSTVDSLLSRGIKSGSMHTLIPICSELSISIDALVNDEILFIDGLDANKNTYSKNEVLLLENVKKLNDIGKNKVYDYTKDLVDSKNYNIETTNTKKYIEIPFVENLRISAGVGSLDDAYSGAVLKKFELNSVTEKADIAYKISGDSMYPLFNDGDIVFLRKQPAVQNGEIGIFSYDNELFCKKRIEVNGLEFLRSENPEYSDIKINENLDLITLGKVLV